MLPLRNTCAHLSLYPKILRDSDFQKLIYYIIYDCKHDIHVPSRRRRARAATCRGPPRPWTRGAPAGTPPPSCTRSQTLCVTGTIKGTINGLISTIRKRIRLLFIE